MQAIAKVREDEDVLRTQNQELRSVVQKLMRFSAVVAHDLKNPISSIAMGAALLTKSRSLPDAIEYGRMIEKAAYRTIRLINDLLEFAKLGNDADVAKEEVDLEEVLREVRADLHAALRQSAGSIELATDLPTVVGHRSQLRQLLQNLVANALKFRSESAPRVTITTLEAPGHWQVSVRDNGIGIDPARLGCLFEPFHRLHAGYEGTGLGLSICKKVVELHGGHLTVRSHLGLGSEFVFTLAKDGCQGARAS